jgi:mannose-6-phosphate isomerase-like protein (cupin superfamily)
MRSMFCVLALLLSFPLYRLIAQGSATPAPAAPHTAAPVARRPPYPMILESNEGEQRIRRPREMGMAAGTFIFKVDRQNGRSRKMVLATEEMKPGAIIPKHKHLDQDEILLIRSGNAHVTVGDLDRDAGPGAVIFIPAGTWVTLKNTGKDNLDLAFVFSGPGFDDYLRCTSVAPPEEPNPQSREQMRDCAQRGHVVYEALEEKPRDR